MRRRPLLGLALLPTLLAGCLAFDESSPAPSLPSSLPPPTPQASRPGPREPGTLVVASAVDPTGLLPPATNEATDLIVSLMYDPLYRLDEHLVPRPVLAAGLPVVSADGLTWTIDMAGDELRFQDGWTMGASDVAFSLELARSSACGLGRELCDAVSEHLVRADGSSTKRLTLTLDQPFAPFLGEVLAQLPVLNETAVRGAVAAMLEGAAGLDPAAPDAQVARILKAAGADECIAASPPFGCRFSDHITEMEATLRTAGLTLPARPVFTDITGVFDAEGYAGALLDRVAALGRTLDSSGIDQLASALPLLDPVTRPLGSGPFRPVSYRPGISVELAANPLHIDGPPGIEHVSVRILRDPATTATALLTGAVDWILKVEPEQRDVLRDARGVRFGLRPLDAQRVIVFNVRPGRIYSDPRTRAAFGLCLDQGTLVAGATGGQGLPATTPTASGSWAMGAPPPAARDVAAARAALAAAGWQPGTDGIMVRDGKRLSSEVAVRQSRSDLLSLTDGAAAQLRECGIELVVRALDLTADLLSSQLQWPNDFDTVLMPRTLGADPDRDLEAYESHHATTADDPADANPGGYASAEADRLILAARQGADRSGRAASYGQLQAVLAADLPAWPIWYEGESAALADRVIGPDGPIDPSQPRYAWDVAIWTLGPLADGAPAP